MKYLTNKNLINKINLIDLFENSIPNYLQNRLKKQEMNKYTIKTSDKLINLDTAFRITNIDLTFSLMKMHSKEKQTK